MTRPHVDVDAAPAASFGLADQLAPHAGRASELLSRPGARVTGTALEVGFESTAAFTRAFEALFGETPATFKQRAQGRGQGQPVAHEQTSPVRPLAVLATTEATSARRGERRAARRSQSASTTTANGSAMAPNTTK